MREFFKVDERRGQHNFIRAGPHTCGTEAGIDRPEACDPCGGYWPPKGRTTLSRRQVFRQRLPRMQTAACRDIFSWSAVADE